MQLVKIDPKEYGLEEKKAAEISKMFKPMLDQMVALEKEFNKIKKKTVSPGVCLEARNLRLQYVKVRTGTEKIHKDLKQFYLQGGRFVDGWKNAQLMASQGIEEKLMNIEKYYENKEKQRIQDLQNDRSQALQDIGISDFIPNNLGDMDEQTWNNYLLGVKESIRLREEAEKKAEEERIERERIQKLHDERKNAIMDLWTYVPEDDKKANFGTWTQENWIKLLNFCNKKKADYEKEQERIRKENEKLKKAAEEKERQEKIEREKKEIHAKSLADKLVAEGYEFDEQLGTYNKEGMIVYHDTLRIITKESLQATIESNERIIKDAQDLKKKIELENKKKEEEKIAREIELAKGDREKYEDLIDGLEKLATKYEFESDIFQSLHKGFIEFVNTTKEMYSEMEFD